MPAPTSVQTWDSNGTNLTTTTSGHRTDGWANNEIPTAGEFNYWQKAVGDWIEWFKTDGGNYYAEREEAITCDTLKLATAGTAIPDANRAADWSWVKLEQLEEVVVGVPHPAGDTITTIDFKFSDLGVAATYTVALRRRDFATSNGFTDVATASDTTAGGGVGTIVSKTLTVNHVMATGYHYQLYLKNTDASDDLRFWGATIKHKRAP